VDLGTSRPQHSLMHQGFQGLVMLPYYGVFSVDNQLRLEGK
jgi:hypothetical protein